MKTHGITANNLDGYTEVNELRLVNNSLKHSANFSTSIIDQIDEIKSKNVHPLELRDFYRRVKDSPIVFLTSVASMIYDDKFNFSNEKLDSIAYSLALRMEKDNATELTKKLLSYYKK